MCVACEERVASTVKVTFLNLFSCEHDRFDEFQRIFEEVVMVYFRLLTCIYFEELGKTAKKS
jgi:hypothetical protein